MELESAVKALIKDTIKWIKEHEDKPSWVIVNFPSFFIHYAKGLLSKTLVFTKYNQLYFLKSRYLNYDFKKGQIDYIKFYVNAADDYHVDTSSIERLNELIAKELIAHRFGIENNKFVENLPHHSKIEEESNTLMNLTTLNNFKF